jgi:hypothetical protein
MISVCVDCAFMSRYNSVCCVDTRRHAQANEGIPRFFVLQEFRYV